MATTKNNKKLNWRKDGSFWKAKGIFIYEADESEGFIAQSDDVLNSFHDFSMIITEGNPAPDLATAKSICEDWYESIYPKVKEYLNVRENQDKLREIVHKEESRLEDEWQKAADKLYTGFRREDQKFENKLDAIYTQIESDVIDFYHKTEKEYPCERKPKSVVTDAMIDAAIESMNSKQSRESVKKALEAAIERSK